MTDASGAGTCEGVPQDDAEPDSPAFILDIDCRLDAWRVFEADLRAHAGFLVAALNLPMVEFSLVLGDDALLARLNETYRGKTGATNVLSFPALDMAAPFGEAGAPALAPGTLLGDIVMSFDTLAREAEAAQTSLSGHALHLFTHGFLHLLGYDHQAEAAAQLMEGLETRLLLAAGLPDPYAENEREQGR